MTYRDTSRDAYEGAPVMTYIRQVLMFYRERGEVGATQWEAVEGTNIFPDSCKPSCTGLEDRGLIEYTGEKRPTPRGFDARVLRVTELGMQIPLGDVYSKRDKSKRERMDEELASLLRFAGTDGKVGEILLGWMKKYPFPKACIELYKTNLHTSKREIQRPLL